MSPQNAVLYFIPTTSPRKENGLLNGEVARGMEPSRPHRERIPAKLVYLRQLEMDTAYITPQRQGESVTTHRRRIYEVLLKLLHAEAQPIGMRVERLWPDTDWDVVWKKLWTTPAPESIKASWYRIIHDIVPTRERLNKIRITLTDQCRSCAEKYTLRHHILECGAGRYQWGWPRQGVALTLMTEPRWVPEEWILRPHFKLWPPKRHRAVLLLLAQFVAFRSQQARELTLQDYQDFLRRSKWKFYQNRNRPTLVGNYLCTLDMI